MTTPYSREALRRKLDELPDEHRPCEGTDCGCPLVHLGFFTRSDDAMNADRELVLQIDRTASSHREADGFDWRVSARWPLLTVADIRRCLDHVEGKA